MSLSATARIRGWHAMRSRISKKCRRYTLQIAIGFAPSCKSILPIAPSAAKGPPPAIG
jgi:hypothetical protein